MSRRGVARVVLGALAVAHLCGAVTMRRRRGQVTVLPPSPGGSGGIGTGESGVVADAASSGGLGAASPGELGGAGLPRVVAAHGCRVGDGMLAAAAVEMAASEADVIGLVPGNLPADRALSLLRWSDLDRLRDDPMYPGVVGSDAVAVAPAVADRMGVAEGGESLERGDLVRRAVAAHRHGRSTVLRVAPDLEVPPVTPRDRWREMAEATAFSRPYGSLTPVLFGAKTAWLAALTAGPLVAPVAGLAALAAWSAQPLLVFRSRGASTTLTPRGLVAASLLRLPRAWTDQLRMVVPALREGRATAARLAAIPVPELPPPDERFDPKHDSCPWCGSPTLAGLLDIPDLIQQKPGTTHLDQCTDCGHVFQNPPLSIKGLDYYYENFYEGIGGETAEVSFASMGRLYRNRIDAVGQFTEPRAWLDVGAGYGHFCLAARRQWPAARFDGLDLDGTVEEGQRRGWVDTAYRGLFPEMADGLPRSYDVVSMHHYLEHTRDPHRELIAATKVLEPGGYLMIEVPDPESPWGRRLGRYWYVWGQPQHLHFVPCQNLVGELEGLGFEVVSIERGSAAMGGDLSAAAVLAIQSVTRNPFVPWLPPPTVAERVTRAGVIAAALPVLAVARLVDFAKDARRSPDDAGNVYRVVARRS